MCLLVMIKDAFGGESIYILEYLRSIKKILNYK